MSSPVARWKYWLSYLYDYPIESRESAVNDTIHLVLSKGRFQLYTENAIYSFEDLYDNFFQAFKKLKFQALPEQASVLILGYGMASIPLMLEKKFHRNYQYTGIELDEEIIDLAYTYIQPRLKSRQEVICADADIYMRSTRAKFDLIIVDLFNDNIIPTKFESEAFLRSVQNKLNPNGLLMYNRLANDDFFKNQAKEYLDIVFTPIFNKAEKIVVEDNWILFSDKDFIQ